MSNEPSLWSDLSDWLNNGLVYAGSNGYSLLRGPRLKIEAKEGHEPTYNSLREKVQQADARGSWRPPRIHVLTEKDFIDREFWETF